MKMFLVLMTFTLTSLPSYASVLPPKQADAICHKKALRAAHFISETSGDFFVSYHASDVAEISTPITYEFHYNGIDEPIVTVYAYAYPNDRTCTLGTIRNNLAGND